MKMEEINLNVEEVNAVNTLRSKEEILTPALVIFKDKSILTERPEDMDYESYRNLRRITNKVISKLFKSPNNPKITSSMGIRINYNQH